MGLKTLVALALLGCTGAIIAQIPAGAAPLSIGNAGSEIEPLAHKIGFRDGKRDRYHGGITYVGRSGLKYAPRYGSRHHGHDVTVKIYVSEEARPRYRQEAKPWIYDLPN
jgi:hypothetical protein